MRTAPLSLTFNPEGVKRMDFMIKILTSVLVSLFILSSSIAARGKDTSLLDSNLTVSVYNDAVIPAATLSEAETIAARIFEGSGIHVVWLNCSPGNPVSGALCKIAVSERNLQVRVGRHSLNLQPSILGISYLSPEGGHQADVFYESIEGLRGSEPTQSAIILGHVMSHEIGHLLLGTNSHSPSGIMRAQWDREQLGLALAGMLSFTKSQSHLMTDRLAKTATAECSPGGAEYSARN
jgi:hypothetical protein